MGSALYGGWKDNPDYAISILDPSEAGAYKSPDEIANKSFDIIVLAVKPQIMDEACQSLRSAKIISSLYVSIAAGKSLKFFEDIFGADVAVIRTMPNTPAMIGQGITIGIANKNITTDQKVITENLLKVSGTFEWISDETLMDAVTALSGSGPAYIFLLIEELAKAGIAAGLPKDLAVKLARQTVIGSAALAAHQSDVPASTLRKNVTSPGGTTEEALKILMAENGLGDLMNHAVQAALKRSRELS